MVHFRQTARVKTGCISAIAFVITILATGPSVASSINTEASSPQRQTPALIPTPARSMTAPTRLAPGLPQQIAGPKSQTRLMVPTAQNNAPRTNTPAVGPAIAPIRQVSIPVLGREGPAARPAARPPAANAISITASEPALTSIVRPQDVATFQKIGAPYQVAGVWYVPAHEPDYDETGVASWYGSQFQGRPTANGEIFDMNVVTGAHPTLPIPSLVEVTNLANGRSIIVRINDRGPFVSSRLIDMSARGAELLGFKEKGRTNVRVRYVGPANSEPMVTVDNISTGRASVLASALPAPAPAENVPAFVQVGAFSQLANAERMRDQASSLGPVRVVETTQGDGNPLYRVVLGPVSSRMEADVKAQEMSTNGFAGARVLASLN
jgi:rare lipoprotein A